MKKNLLLSSVLGCMLMAAPVSADVIGMRTAAPIGEKLSIALNENVKATIAWGDGSTEEVAFNGSEVELSVKHADLTLTTASPVTFLFCPDCSLTELDLKEVPNLTSLVCADNKLTELELKNVQKLTELNCEGNELKALYLTKCKDLVSVNCSRNQLTTLGLTYQSDLKTLICGYNKLRTISASNNHHLESVWCQGNEISTINLSSSARPKQICAFDNALTNLNKGILSESAELWLDNNKLSKLDLSETPIQVLSASSNELKEILLDKKLSENLEAFYVDNNQLLINSLPTVFNKFKEDSVMHYNISNQKPYVVTDQININEKLSLTDLLRVNAIRYTIRPQVEWLTEEGTSLVAKEDYTERNYEYTFLKPFKSVYAKVTSDYYPNEIFYIAKFQVVDPTGIEDINAANGLKISSKAGQLYVEAAAATRVKVYTVSGALMVDEVVSAGAHSWSLPVGVYVVNGQKVVLNH